MSAQVFTTIIVIIGALAISLAYLGFVLWLRGRGEREVALEREASGARESAAAGISREARRDNARRVGDALDAGGTTLMLGGD
jgi:hypothetical protein